MKRAFRWLGMGRPPAEAEAGDDLSRPAEHGDDRIPLSALPMPALLLDDWRIVAASREAMALFGERISDSDLRQTVRHPLLIEAVLCCRTGRPPPQRELRLEGAGGASFRPRAVLLADGRVLLLLDDTTRERQTERMRMDFVANASHELRTPLASIRGFVETLQESPPAESELQQHFLSVMAQEAQRMGRLIDDLLSLSRIELDRHVRPATRLQLPPVLREAAAAFAARPEAQGRPVQLEVAGAVAGEIASKVFDRAPGKAPGKAPGEAPDVLADHDQILQALHNLLTNAGKYGRAGTPIRLALALGPRFRGQETLRVSVADEGEGIAAEHLPRLAERFYRIDAGRSRALGGTGLGLSIVRQIVERHRGRLDIESELGKGSCISFLLPLAPPLAPPQSPALQSPSS